MINIPKSGDVIEFYADSESVYKRGFCLFKTHEGSLKSEVPQSFSNVNFDSMINVPNTPMIVLDSKVDIESDMEFWAFRLLASNNVIGYARIPNPNVKCPDHLKFFHVKKL